MTLQAHLDLCLVGLTTKSLVAGVRGWGGVFGLVLPEEASALYGDLLWLARGVVEARFAFRPWCL